MHAVLAEESLTRLCSNTESPAAMDEKENILAIWQLSGSVLLQCFLTPLGVLFIMKTLEDEQCIAIKT